MDMSFSGAVARRSSLRTLALVGSALGSTMVAGAAGAQNVSSNGATDYSLTETGTRSGGPRTVDITTNGGNITLDLGTVNSDNPGNTQGAAIGANNTGPGAVSVKAAGASATGAGLSYAIDARATTGALTVTNTGTVSASGNNADRAIYAASAGGDITVTSNTANGQQRGISTNANPAGAGAFGTTGTTTINSTTATANGTGQVNAILGQGARVVINSGATSNTNTAGNGGTAIFANAGAGGVLVNAGTTSALGQGQAAMQIFSGGAVDVTSGTVRTTQNSDGISIASGSSVVVRSTSVTNEGANGGYGIVLGANRGGGGFNSGADGFAYTAAAVTSGAVSVAGANAFGIYATPNGAGTTTINSGTLTATGTGSVGIYVSPIGNGTSSGAINITSDTLSVTNAGNAFTTAGIVVGNANNQYAGNTGVNTGAVTIVSNKLTASGLGIDAGAAQATVTSTDLTSVNGGILAQGTGSKTITSGKIGNTGGDAISTFSTNGGAVAVKSTTITGVGNGINASGGDLTVDSGSIALSTTATANRPNSLNGLGITALSSGTTATALKITSGSVVYTGTGNTYGISAQQGSTGGGTLDITSGTVTTTGNGGYGVLGFSAGAAITINSTGNVTTVGTTRDAGGQGTAASQRYADGIDALSQSGTIVVNNSGTISTAGVNARGITAEQGRAQTTFIAPSTTASTAALTLNNTGTVKTTGNTATAINVQNDSGAATIASNIVSTAGTNAVGINASTLAGTLSITSANLATTGTGANGVNIAPMANTAMSGAVTINNTGLLQTSGANASGIRYTGGTGALTINNTGTISTGGASGLGLFLSNTNGAMITSNVITTTGAGVSTGIQLGSAAGATNSITINSGAINITNASSSGSGIGVTASTAGATTITSGTINNAGTGSGIGVNTPAAATGDVTITSGDITLSAPPSTAFRQAIGSFVTAGTTTINSTGTIQSGGNGILVQARAGQAAGAVNITSNVINSANSAIRVDGGGSIAIKAATTTTSGAGQAAISVVPTTGGAVLIQAGSVTTTGANALGVNLSTDVAGKTGIAVGSANTTAGAVDARTQGDLTVTAGVTRVTGSNATGLTAISSGGSTTVNSTDLTSANRGIFAQGLNNATVTSGMVTSGGVETAIFAQTATNPQTGGAAGVVRVDSTTINSGGSGISAFGPRADVIVNSGTITSAGGTTTALSANGVNATVTSGAITANGTGINASFATGAATLGTSTVNSGTVAITGIDAGTTGAIQASNAAVAVTSDTITNTGAGNRFGINAQAIQPNAAGSTLPDSVSVTSKNITTVGDGAYGINALSQTGAVTVASTGTITTVGGTRQAGNQLRYSAGIVAASVSGNIAVTSNAIVTGGADADGVRVEANSGQVTYATGLAAVAGTVAVTSTGPITTAGDNAAGVRVLAGGSATTLNLTGAVRTGGATAYGVFAQSGAGAISGTFGDIAATGAGADAVRLLSDSGAITASVTGALSSAGGVGLFIDPPSTVVVNVAAGARVTGLTGINVTGATNTLTNLGTVTGTAGAGVVATGATALVNGGTLSGAGGVAAQLGATDDSVTLRTGSAVSGRIVGGGGTDAAILAGTVNTASPMQQIAGFDGFSTLTVQNGYWTAVAATPSSFANSITTTAGSTLDVANGATGLVVTAPSIVDNGTLVVRSGAASAGPVFGATVVTGSGGVLFTGAGTATLAGANSIQSTGAVTVDNGSTVLITGTQGGAFVTAATGTLQVGAGGATGAFTGTLLDNGTLVVNRSDDYSFTGGVSGGGNIVKQGAGKLTFGTNFAFTGVTTIQAGSIKLSTPVAANTELDLEGAGQLDLSGTTQRIAELAGASPAASLNIAGGSLTDVQNTNSTFAGTIVGNGTLTKSGTGRLNLTGANTYGGPTTVNGGTLAVNGSIVSPVTVASGGTLGGTGSVSSVTIGSGGTYAPGNSIGTQTVAGNVTFAAGSSFAVEANAAGQADRINATGTATLAGGNVAVAPTAGTYANLTNYTILTAAGGVTGTFATATSADATLTPFLAYGANAVTLTLARNNVSFAGMGATANQASVGTAITALGVNSGIYRGLLPLSAAAASAALGSLSGELYASLPASLADGSKQVREAVLARATQPGDGVGLWATGTRTLAGSRRQDAITPVIDNRWTAIGGVDFSLSGLRVGIDGGYIEDVTRVRRQGAQAHTDTTLVGGHLGYAMGPVSIVVGGDYAWHDISASRNLGVAGFAGATAADAKAHTLQGYGEIGYGVTAGDLTVLPFARFSYVHLVSDAFTESGGLGALSVGRDERNYKFGTLGVRVTGAAPIAPGVTFLPRFSGSYTRGWDVGGSRTLAFAGTTPLFTERGAALGRNSYDVNAGFDIGFGRRLTMGVGGFGSTSHQWSEYGAKASVGLKF